MAGAPLLLVFLHVFANLIWIGSLLAVGLVLATPAVADAARGTLARRIYLRLSVPAFLISFAAGLVRLAMDVELYLVQTKYMHAKLTCAVIIIALHHVLGARARRLASGKQVAAMPTHALSAGVLLAAAAATYLVLGKPF